MMNYENFVLNDFSGGITDRFIGVNNNQCVTANNFLVTEYNTLKLRAGFDVKYDQETIERINGLYSLNDDIFFQRANSLYLLNSDSGTIVSTPEGTAFFEYSNNLSSPSFSTWRDQLFLANIGDGNNLSRPMGVFRNSLGNVQSHSLGLPAFEEGTLALTSTGAGNDYYYAFAYSYTYNVGEITYTNKSSTYVLPTVVDSVNPIGTDTVYITNIPEVLAGGNNYNIAEIKVEIYRTVVDGSVFYKVGEVDNGTSSFNDNIIDDVISLNEILYTDGGLVEFGATPKCKYMMVVKDIAYYSNTEDEDGTKRPYRIYQAIAGIPSAVNPSYYDDMDSSIVGMSELEGVPILFTESFIYRIEGVIDSSGSGALRKKVISSDVGCVGHNSIVKAGGMIYFGGNNGFYVTDGFTVKSITTQLYDSYSEITNTATKRSLMFGEYDEKKDLIHWAVTETGSENNKIWVLNISTNRFTTASGTSFYVSCLLSMPTELLRGDNLGYIYSHRDDLYSDLLRDQTVDSSLWEKTHIQYEYKSIAFDFGHPSTRKWVPSISFNTKTNTPLVVKPYSSNDGTEAESEMKGIVALDRALWGDPNITWGNPSILWSPPVIRATKRSFPKNSRRCRLKQITLRPSIDVLFNSDVLGNATVSPVDADSIASFTAVIDSSTSVWPEDAVGYSISFEMDGYSSTHLIETRSDTTIVFAGGQVPVGSVKWQISGYWKEQDLELKSLDITYSPMADVGTMYKAEESGDNE